MSSRSSGSNYYYIPAQGNSGSGDGSQRSYQQSEQYAEGDACCCPNGQLCTCLPGRRRKPTGFSSTYGVCASVSSFHTDNLDNTVQDVYSKDDPLGKQGARQPVQYEPEPRMTSAIPISQPAGQAAEEAEEAEGWQAAWARRPSGASSAASSLWQVNLRGYQDQQDMLLRYQNAGVSPASTQAGPSGTRPGDTPGNSYGYSARYGTFQGAAGDSHGAGAGRFAHQQRSAAGSYNASDYRGNSRGGDAQYYDSSSDRYDARSQQSYDSYRGY